MFNYFPVLALIAMMVVTPFIFLLTTAFIKAAVLLLILRNAIGLQQTPPNMVVYVIAGSIAFFVGWPMFNEAYQATSSLVPTLDMEEFENWVRVFEAGVVPFQEFLARNVDERSLNTFQEMSKSLWPEQLQIEDPKLSLALLMPAFVLSELVRAFQMGFMIFLPFLAVDLIVTTLLMALGMQQVTPNIVSVPFKLLLFVVLDGWYKITSGLLMTYA